MEDNNLKVHQRRIALTIIMLVLIVDQIVKILVKTNMSIGEQIQITKWFQIVFVENNGMAFGMEILSKLFLSLFRIMAIGFFSWYLFKIVGKGFPTGYIVIVSLIIAGAAGNVIDCILYGQIFTASGYGPEGVAHMTAFGDGYASVFYGKVVDMFYFPLWTWPDWVPLIGGNIFFSPIFNVADSCISCGIVILAIFYSKYVNYGFTFKTSSDDNEETKS